MSVNPTTSSNLNDIPRYEPQARVVKKTLGQDEFLSLLTAQLQNQDPLNPMSDTDFIAQMANFTSLEQTKSISQTLSALSSSLQQNAATSYMGYQVSLTDEDGNAISGVVSEVGTMSNGKTYVMVNGTQYDASKITSVKFPQTNNNN